VHYEIEVGGRTRQVVVTRVGGGFAVTVDRRTWQVDAARIDAHTLSLIVDSVPEKGAVGDVSVITDPSTGLLTVHVGPTPVEVTVNGRRRWGRKDDGGASGGPQQLIAPMPGKIVRVLAKVGVSVQPRQPLVVVEAMKMENELRATRSGVVSALLVQEGQSVDAGALLLIVTPE